MICWYVMIINPYAADEQAVQALRDQGLKIPTHYSFFGADDTNYEDLKREFEERNVSVIASKKGIPIDKINDFSDLCEKIVEDLNKGNSVEAQKELDSIVV